MTGIVTALAFAGLLSVSSVAQGNLSNPVEYVVPYDEENPDRESARVDKIDEESDSYSDSNRRDLRKNAMDARKKSRDLRQEARMRRSNFKQEARQRAQEQRDRVQEIRDERLRKIAAGLSERFQMFQTRWVAHWDLVLERFVMILEKMEAKAQEFEERGADTADVMEKIEAARESISSAQRMIDEFAGKEYLFDPGEEADLGESIRSVIEMMRADSQSVRESVLEARQSLNQALQSLRDMAQTLNDSGEVEESTDSSDIS